MTPSPSCKQKLMSVSLPRSNCEDPDSCSLLCGITYATIVSCLRELTPSNLAANYIFGPILCLSSASHFSYLVAGYASMSVLPLDCKVVPDSHFPMRDDDASMSVLDFSGTTTISWYDDYYYYQQHRDRGGIINNCTWCEQGGRRCGFSPDRNQTFCMNHGIISNWTKPCSHMILSFSFSFFKELHIVLSYLTLQLLTLFIFVYSNANMQFFDIS